MPEELTLAAPINTRPGTSRLLPFEITMRRGVRTLADGTAAFDPAGSLVKVRLFGDNQTPIVEDEWTGAEADADIVAISKADLRTNTLHKRIMNKLAARGTIKDPAGTPIQVTVSGVPD